MKTAAKLLRKNSEWRQLNKQQWSRICTTSRDRRNDRTAELATRQNKPWSKREIEYLTKFSAIDIPDIRIAFALSRTMTAVANKRRELGISHKHLVPKKKYFLTKRKV